MENQQIAYALETGSMVIPFRIVIFILAILTGFAASISVFAEELYDRLDGTGLSRKKVDVIEWEGNLELHIAPKGSTAGVGPKLDTRTESKQVMVIAYRFKGQKDVLVRRAILGIDFDPKLKGYIDPTEKDYDKLAISNQKLESPWKPYPFDAAPKQWYPDGDERNEELLPAIPSVPFLSELKKTEPTIPKRAPASIEPEVETKFRGEGSLNHYNW